MLSPVRLVPPREYSRCPDCHCFVRLDAGTCTACGLAFALASGTRSAKTHALDKSVHLVQGVAVESIGFQSGPKGNAQYSNLQPDGKILKQKKQLSSANQMNLFHGVL
jgi:hypothetical protein